MDYGLDAKSAANICKVETYGDWYRDPWGWPEISWIESKPSSFPWNEVVRRDGGVDLRREPRFEPTVIPKSRLGVRPAVVMSLDVRIAYAAAVSQVMSRLTELPDWVYGWRRRGGPKLASNSTEWSSYSAFFHREENQRGVALQTDITSFFASIPVSKVVDLLHHSAGGGAGTKIISSIITAHDGLASRSGLPQRSWPSAILANRYMAPLDVLVSQRLQAGRLNDAVRWMDDVYVTGNEESALYRFFLDFQSRVRELGLEVNTSKSNLGKLNEFGRDVLIEQMDFADIPSMQRVKVMQRGSDVGEMAVEITDIQWLRRLEHSVLEGISRVPAATLKLVLKLLRRHDEFGQFDRWLDSAPQCGHIADSLGRYFRDGMKSEKANVGKYCDWYSAYRCTEVFSTVLTSMSRVGRGRLW